MQVAWVLVIESLGSALAVLALVSLVGYGVVALCIGEMAGWELLLVPAVGWAVAVVGVQWLAAWLAPPVAFGVVLLGAGMLSVGMAWRGRASFMAGARERRGDLAFVLGVGIASYLALLAFVFTAGLFGFNGVGTDGLWLYAPVADYLSTHTFAFWADKTLILDRPTNLGQQALVIHAFLYPAIGQMDAALSGILRQPAMRLLEPLGALCVVGALPGVYLLCVRGLGCARRTAVAACLLTVAHPLVAWVMAMDFAEQTRVAPLVPTCLFLLVHALRTGRKRVAALAGVVAAPVLAVYFPIFAVLALCVAAYLVVAIAASVRRKQIGVTLVQSGIFVVTGAVAAIPSLYILVVERPSLWLNDLSMQIVGAGVTRFFPLRYLVGASPLADPLKIGPPSLWQTPTGTLFANLVTVTTVALIALGLATLLARRHGAEAAMLAAPLVYLASLRFGAGYPYGFTRTLCYVVPLTSILIAIGALEFPRLFRPIQGEVIVPLPVARAPARPRIGFGWRDGLALIGVGALGATLFAQGYSSAVMQYNTTKASAVFPPYFAHLDALPALVPSGAAVYLYNEGDSVAIRKEIAAALYLPNRNVTVANHPFVHRDPAQEEITIAGGFPPYDYLLLPTPLAKQVSGGFAPLWNDFDTQLTLLRRTGPDATFTHRPNTPMVQAIVHHVVVQAMARGVALEATNGDALGELARVYLGRADLQQAYGRPTAVALPALLAWAAGPGATMDDARAKLAPFAPQFAALAQQAARVPPFTVAFFPASLPAPSA